MHGRKHRLLGGAAILHGGIVTAVSFAGLGAAIRAAEILYAEDFDRAAHVPGWFGPWWVAMQHRLVAYAVVLTIGTALFLTGVLLATGWSKARRLAEPVCWAALAWCMALSIAPIPLWDAGSGWPPGTPAQALRGTLFTSIGYAWLETLILLATVIAMRRTRLTAA